MSAYKRILLKVSGEALSDPTDESHAILSKTICQNLVKEIKAVHDLGVEIGIVVGGGNIFRGKLAADLGVERIKGDQMGMLATVINAIGLEGVLRSAGVPACVHSAIPACQAVEEFNAERAKKQIAEKTVVIFAAGTGNPFFTTDTGAALRAVQTGCDVFFKSTKVPGVFDKDPIKHSDAVKYDRLTFGEALEKNLQVLDQTAFALCRENKLPILVFKLGEEGNLMRAVQGESVGTLVTDN